MAELSHCNATEVPELNRAAFNWDEINGAIDYTYLRAIWGSQSEYPSLMQYIVVIR